MSSNTMTASSPFNMLKRSIAEFASRNPGSILTFNKGHRLITEGTQSDDVFVIQHGSLSILVKTSNDASEKEVALRSDGDLIGETAILQTRGPRNASVVVVSPSATLVR